MAEAPTINDELVNKLIYFFDDDNNNKQKKGKCNNTTTKCFGEALRLFVVEALQRAGEEARIMGEDKIEIRHVQSIVGQMLLDF